MTRGKPSRIATIWFMVLAGMLLTGCAVGPNYKRPPVTVPDGYRAAPPDQSAASIGDEKWWTVFHDEQLQKLIRQALAQNYDVRIAAERVLEAQASLALFWELDFWGKYRRATQAARATLLATEWGRRAVITSLVSNVASAYF